MTPPPLGSLRRQGEDDRSPDLAFARWLALATSRRTFLRKLFRRAFVIGAAGSLLGTVLMETASAYHVCSDAGNNPYCNSSCCNASTMNCHNNSTARVVHTKEAVVSHQVVAGWSTTFRAETPTNAATAALPQTLDPRLALEAAVAPNTNASVSF